MKHVGYSPRQETPSLCDPMNAIKHLPITSPALPGRLPIALAVHHDNVATRISIQSWRLTSSSLPINRLQALFVS